MKVVRDDPWTCSHDALLSSDFASRQLPAILRDALRDAYGSVLSEGIPEKLARCLQRLEPEREGPPGGTPARQGPEPPPRE